MVQGNMGIYKLVRIDRLILNHSCWVSVNTILYSGSSSGLNMVSSYACHTLNRNPREEEEDQHSENGKDYQSVWEKVEQAGAEAQLLPHNRA
jgi:hypothetical protein